MSERELSTTLSSSQLSGPGRSTEPSCKYRVCERAYSGSYHEDSREEELKTLKEKIAKQKFEILIPEIKTVEETKIEADVTNQLSRLEVSTVTGKGKGVEEESTSLSNTSNKGGDTNSAKLSPLKTAATTVDTT